MSLDGSYDPDNIFAKILRGQAPCHRIYENDDILAFLDIFPQATGHTLVIPKRAAARNLFDIDPDQLCLLHRGAQTVARGLVDELKPQGLQVFQINGAPAGQTVFHIHVHLIPRWEGDPMKMHASVPGDPEALKALAARLSNHFATGD